VYFFRVFQFRSFVTGVIVRLSADQVALRFDKMLCMYGRCGEREETKVKQICGATKGEKKRKIG
jgi:hypothetical protein